jgi:acetyl-CoA synthetase
MANALKALGARRGDRITIYLPMIPEAAMAMLACARIGAIHSVVFGGFSPEALAGRIQDCDSRLVITADAGMRGGKRVPLKENVDEALKHCTSVQAVLVVEHVSQCDTSLPFSYHLWSDLRVQVSDECPAEEMGAEDPLFILYTSGSTGKPKGVLHTTGGYLTWATMTHHYVFDYRPRRDLLVRGRRRLGHGAQLRRLRPAGQCGDGHDVRGRAQLPRPQPLLADRRPPPGQHLLRRARPRCAR